MLDWLKARFRIGRRREASPRESVGVVRGLRVQAAAQMPPPEDPKGVKKGQVVVPSYLRSARPNPKTALAFSDPALINSDLTTLRASNSTRSVIHDYVRASPDLSAAVTSYIRTGVTKGWTAFARNLDGTINPDATGLLAQIITRMNVLNDYTIGYDDSPSLRALAEIWAKEIMLYGGMAGELVLNKALLPDKIQPVSLPQISLYPSGDGRKLVPKQSLGGTEVSLDVPTFFMVTLDQDLLDAYAQSPIESAIQPVLFSVDFLNDIRRIVKKSIHPRMDAVIDEEKLRKGIPEDAKYDQAKLDAYLSQVLSDLEGTINGLAPEDALVHFDAIGVDVIDHGNTNLSNEYKVIQDLMDKKMATGAKVLPVVLGKSDGTSNVASTEAMMFVKYVEGAVWGKLNEMFSKIFTLAVRLLGQDVYVEFTFDGIDLRPQSELESFKALKQSRTLELLSLGLLTDEQAAIELTGQLPPAGYKPLAGTMFMQNKLQPVGDGYNGASNSGSTMNQNLNPSTPTGGARGQNKKAEVLTLEVAR